MLAKQWQILKYLALFRMHVTFFIKRCYKTALNKYPSQGDNAKLKAQNPSKDSLNLEPLPLEESFLSDIDIPTSDQTTREEK